MRKNQFNWGTGIFLIVYQSLVLISLPIYFTYCTPSWGLFGMTALWWWLAGLAITVGYHRYYSHKTFKVGKRLEAILLFFGSMAAQDSVLRWAFEHRMHHAHVDTDDDPYAITKGFWYAHMGWLFKRPVPIEKKVVADLMQNPLVMFQHRHALTSMIVTNAIAFFFTGWLLNDYIGAFVISLWFRMFWLHHFTWFINSLAHTWGDKPFSEEQSAVNNFVISFLTFGEGYHNYHHTYANDYRNGVRWYHFDPSKWLIWTLSRLGLANRLSRVDWETIEKRKVLEGQRLLREKLSKTFYVKKELLDKRIDEFSDSIMAKIGRMRELKKELKKIKEKKMIKEVRMEIRRLKKALRSEVRLWGRFSRNVMHLPELSMQLT